MIGGFLCRVLSEEVVYVNVFIKSHLTSRALKYMISGWSVAGKRRFCVE